MPPRLQSAWRMPVPCFTPQLRPAVPAASALLARLSLAENARHAHILGSLSDRGSSKNRRRVGRGPSSGRGKTAGRGQKGQWAHGKVKPWFQGGQTPLIVTLGRKGKDNVRAPVMSIANLDQIQEWVDLGRLDASKQITPKELIECGIIGKVRDGVKLLARGKEKLTTPIDIMISRASSEAIEAVETAGGKVVTRYYTKQSIKWLLEGKAVSSGKPLPFGPEHVEEAVAEARERGFKRRLPDPTSRPDIEYYRDPAHRGYLSHTLKPGENPSLLYGVPREKRSLKPVVRAAKSGARAARRSGARARDQTLWTL